MSHRSWYGFYMSSKYELPWMTRRFDGIDDKWSKNWFEQFLQKFRCSLTYNYFVSQTVSMYLEKRNVNTIEKKKAKLIRIIRHNWIKEIQGDMSKPRFSYINEEFPADLIENTRCNISVTEIMQWQECCYNTCSTHVRKNLGCRGNERITGWVTWSKYGTQFELDDQELWMLRKVFTGSSFCTLRDISLIL